MASFTYREINGNMLIVTVVNDIVLVLVDDIHGGEHVQRVVHTSLHIFEVDFLS